MFLTVQLLRPLVRLLLLGNAMLSAVVGVMLVLSVGTLMGHALGAFRSG